MLFGILEFFSELLVEALQRVGPRLFAILDFVKFFFQAGSVLRIEDVLEVLHQQIGDNEPDFGRDELPANLLHILPLLNGADDGGVGRRPADAALFQLLHQRRFVEAWRRFGEVLLRLQFFQRELLAFTSVGSLCLSASSSSSLLSLDSS